MDELLSACKLALSSLIDVTSDWCDYDSDEGVAVTIRKLQEVISKYDNS
jgi:hypothetical protein